MLRSIVPSAGSSYSPVMSMVRMTVVLVMASLMLSLREHVMVLRLDHPYDDDVVAVGVPPPHSGRLFKSPILVSRNRFFLLGARLSHEFDNDRALYVDVLFQGLSMWRRRRIREKNASYTGTNESWSRTLMSSNDAVANVSGWQKRSVD